jgi:hypothetical protein
MGWLRVVQEIQRIAQAGLAYSKGPFDRDRYTQLMGLAAEIGSEPLGTSKGHIEEIFRAEKGYPTPKVDVPAVVPKDGKLLFVREVTDGKWALPGGWADIGSTPKEMDGFDQDGEFAMRQFSGLRNELLHSRTHRCGHAWKHSDSGSPLASGGLGRFGCLRSSRLRNRAREGARVGASDAPM